MISFERDLSETDSGFGFDNHLIYSTTYARTTTDTLALLISRFLRRFN